MNIIIPIVLAFALFASLVIIVKIVGFVVYQPKGYNLNFIGIVFSVLWALFYYLTH